MLRHRIAPASFFAISGAVIALASIPVMGIIMAIAIPPGFLGWFKEHGALGLGIFALNTSMISATVGLLAFAGLLGAYRFLFPATRLSVIAFLLGVFTAKIAIELLYGFPILLYAASAQWWHYSYEFSVALAAFFAYLVVRRLGHNYSFKRTPGPHPA